MGRLATRDRSVETDPDVVDVDDGVDEYDDVDVDDEYDAADGSPPRSLGWILTLGGVLGFLAAFILTLERLEMLQDPNYSPTCSIDAVLQCSTVMTSDQAELFGFSNPLIGIAAFPVVVTVGVLALSRVTLPPWFWRWILAGATYGIAFVGWLISQSLYEIRALCPYCLVVWASMIPIFWRTLGWTLASGQFGDGVAENRLVQVLERRWWVAALATYLLVGTLVVTAFPYYFF